MGAALTQHPDLMQAVVSHVGIYDMLRVELDPNGSFNVTEFGSVKDADQFQALFAYSPYHHVAKGVRYPAVLFLSAEQDDRVDPMHARKMAAALQAANASDRRLLFRLLEQSGHSGADRVQAQVDEAADRLSFLFQEVGKPQVRLGLGIQGSWPGTGN